MKKADDKLIVKKDLTFEGASTYQDLTNGVIELAGNFYQKGVETTYGWGNYSTKDSVKSVSNNAYSFYPTENNHISSFYPTENFKVILNGKSLQRVSFESPDSSRFMNLEIVNDDVIFDLDAGKKVSVIDGLYLDESLYNSTYKDNEFITYGRYRDIHKTYMPLTRGLHLIALPIKASLDENQIKTIFSDVNISYVLKYDFDNSQWQGFSNSSVVSKKMTDAKVETLTNLDAGDGIFVDIEGDVELKFPRDNGYKFADKVNIESLASGWHLLGTNRLVKLDKLLNDNSEIKLIWRYKDSKWSFLSNDSEIKEEYRRREIPQSEDTNATNSGFWVYVN
ncbi:hypothetical protein MNB_SV-14-502 [hydrothermal vent metagenome]|uniref:Uncharacterized protein n=1 Tax=hydrothermal vent metagenome TaxID=652676 RepID=A0A1W1CU00_9ZZZZ